jgi:hypothetical protein
VGGGQKAIFWLDVWSGNCPLMITFPKIFAICNQQNWVVTRVLRNGSINLTFRRNFGESELTVWENLKSVLEDVALNSERDTVRWIFEKSGNSLHHHFIES